MKTFKNVFQNSIIITYLPLQWALGQNFNYIIHDQPLEGLKSSLDMIFCPYQIWQNSLFSPFGGSWKKTNNIMA